jgi:iron complex outermembrane receptor protein
MAVPFVNRLVLTSAGRWDSYSDFGDTFNPQYGVEWNPVASLLLRASYGDSFRPPSLFDLYSPRTTTTSTITDPRRNNETVAYQLSSGGNPSLNPEEGDSINAGFVLTLGDFHHLRFGANYWRIRLDDRTQPLTATAILANESMFPTRVARADPTTADLAAGLPGRLLSLDRTSVNFGAADTHGIDLEFSQSFDSDMGRFSPSLLVTRVSKYEAADLPNTPPVDRVGIANSQGTIPEWKGNAALAWNLGGLGIAASLRYVSDYDDVTTANIPNGRTIPSTTFVDVQLSLDLGAGFRAHAPWLGGTVVRVGAINLFDKGPHFAEVGSTFGYDTSQADARQRLAYMYVTKSF